jgi:hypothetical protein
VRRDAANDPPQRLPINLPLKIRQAGDSFAVEDAAGRNVSYVYFSDEAPSGQPTKWFSEAEAREIAQMIARLLTDVEGDAESAMIPLEEPGDE